MKNERLICVLLCSLIVAACTTSQRGDVPEVTGASPTSEAAGHLIPMGVRPKNCPGKFIYCVTVAEDQKVQLYFCYSPGSYCGGPSEYQYYWSGSFKDSKGHPVTYFATYFEPNPGDPTTDTIMEARKVKPTYGVYKYEEWVCAWQDEICQSKVYVGIAVQ